ncbi:MAG: serine/threonine-protein kinase, partial [Planctomycetota bacterium]|nr:serine/threonine-protein kinase [Planctomycetota bacterium]
MEGAFECDPFQDNERFDTVAELGRGAFGSVYLVNDKSLGRRVAAKVLHNTTASALALFKQEFRSLADIVSPYLIQFYELFSDGQKWFFTMEYIDGLNFKDFVLQGFPPSSGASPTPPVAPSFSFDAQTLIRPQDRLQEPPVPGPSSEQAGEKIQSPEQHHRLQSAFCQLVTGIDYLHSQGKLHRDLKPSNVLVCRDGRVVLLDFGLVADLRNKEEDNSDDPMSGSGTPIYMSPEQAGGDDLDEASDWYSLGVMLYEVLAGRPPFTGRLLKLLFAKQSKDPEPIFNLAHGASNEILLVCQQLIHRDPTSRPRARDILKKLGVKGRQNNVEDVRHQHQHLLIGRDQYFRQMLDFYESVQSGQSRLLFVHGPSGFGKSHLIEHFLQHVKDNHKDALILSGRCFQQESMPFKAWDQPIDSLSRFLTDYSGTATELVPDDCVCLMRLFPVLENVPAYEDLDIDGIDIADPKEIRRRAFRALRHLLREISKKKTIIIYMDDVHWGDLDSQLLIEEVLRSPGSPSLLLLCSYRDADAEVSTF